MTEEAKADSSSDLEQLKTLFTNLKIKLSRLESPTDLLRQMCEALKGAAATDRMGKDQEFANWVNGEVAISLTQKLAKTTSFDQNYVNVVADTMEAITELFANELKNKRYHENFTCALTWCFQPEETLHKRNFQMSNDDLRRLSTSRQTWRSALKVGDQVDVKVSGDEKDKTSGWAQACITRIEGELLSVVFPELPTDFDRDVAIWSTDVAQFETRTKEDYEWRRANLAQAGTTDYLADIHDNFRWEEGTLFSVSTVNSSGRPVVYANCGFRVYRTYGKKIRQDERGPFDGWSCKYDELIPVFSPRMQPHLSRVNGAVVDDDDINEDLDDLMTPDEGHDRVYCVPRLSACISSKFISFMNNFGNSGGFACILDALANGTPDDKLTLTTMGYMITMISMPSKLFHRDWLAEFAAPIVAAMKAQLLGAPDKILQKISANDVSQMQISIVSINSRIMDKETGKEDQERLKLEICKKCLSSELLERRILGIRELNTIIRNSQVAYGITKVFSTEWLIGWMIEFGVFEILWDPKKTHMQLVQRSGDIFKVLPKENLLTMELLKQFWSLSKSDYKSEVFKILNDAAFYLKQEHIEYLFDEITETPAAKLGLEELDALSGLGRFSRSPEFQAKTSNFFARIINHSDEFKAELITNCINKFADMIKHQGMDKKQSYFDNLVEQLQTGTDSAVPVIRLFKKIIKDQKSKGAMANSGYNGATAVATVANNAGDTSAGWGNTESIYQGNRAQGGQGAAEEDEQEEETQQQVTLTTVLNRLCQQQGFVEALLGNLQRYCEAVQQKVAQDTSILDEKDRTQLFVLSPKNSHQAEINERLSFLQEFAVNSDFKISKAQLQVIYDLLTQSPVKSDFDEFLTWCNTACKAQTAKATVLDLEELGEFFSELIRTKNLNLKALPVIGFEFLKMYFTSQNREQQKLLMIAPAEKKKPAAQGWSGGYYGTSWSSNTKQEEVATVLDDEATFKVAVDPSELTKIDMLWEIALQSENEEVINKSVYLLVNCYISVNDNLEDKRSQILQGLNSRCFELIAASQNDPAQIKRIIRVLEYAIYVSEKKGTGGVQPHNALLKGEMLDRIIIRYMVKNKQSYWGGLKLDRSVVVKLYTSATVWDFKKEVSQILGLAPQYIKLTLPNKDVLRDNMHGRTLQELLLKNGDILTAEKLSLDESVTEAPLIDPQTRQLVPRAVEIFTEWYQLYKNETGLMDGASVAAFIAGATKQTCTKSDQRVTHIVGKYDTDKDGAINLEDFLRFYTDSASGTSVKAVYSNLKNFNVRVDLKKMSEVVEEVDYAENEMPRHTLSANQEQFQTLFSLLDRNDESSQDVWELVRMLATNQQIYQEVLSLSQAQQEDGVDWSKVFEDSSLFKQIYKQEIIVAVMEASKTGGDTKRVMFVEEQRLASAQTYSATGAAAGQAAGADEGDAEGVDEATQDTEATAEDQATEERVAALKANWTQQFLEKDGFNYVLDSFLGQDVSSTDASTFSEQASLKDLAFQTTLLRVFLHAGFNAQEGGIGKALKFVRKSSNISEEGNAAGAPEKEDHLLTLMGSPEGQDIMLNTDFDKLFDKALALLATLLSKSSLILEDKIIIENALSLILGILLFKKDVYAKFVAFTSTNGKIRNTEELVLAGLLCSEEKVRIDFERTFRILSIYLNKAEQNSLYFLLGCLARNFARIQNRPSRQFFELFNRLIDQKALRDDLLGDAADDSSAIYNPEDLLNQIIDKIKAQQKLKQDAAANENDDQEQDEIKALELAAEQERLLVGLITLTGKIIAKADKAVSDRIIQEKDLIGQIFKEFLFASYYQAQADNEGDAIVLHQQAGSRDDKKQAAAPNNKSRQAAYGLLHQLIGNSTTLMKTFLDSQLVPLIQTIKKPKGWNYVPPTQTSGDKQKYVGLRNLGCICYMNSMMQQFFMTPAFRYNLLCVDDGKPEAIAEYKGEQIDDNMMHQVQKMFAMLELSERNDFNPMQFCFAFKEFDGQPTNTAEQKDSQEFLNVFFDRLEHALKETSRKHLVQGVFGGKQCSQMVCTECGKVKNRMEDYLNLSIPIKGVKSIEEALAKQIEGEIISDYQCDGCNRKVDLQKRTMIATTPNVLIVHLQRICFNFDTFQNDKVNTLCSFPNVLDLKPYSFHDVMGRENRLAEQQTSEEQSEFSGVKKEELTEEELLAKQEAEDEKREPERDDCYEYKLVGVNVHSGTANAGHYWSYINTNRGTDEKEGDTKWLKTEADSWMEFNDSRVSDWEFKEIEQRTFGNQNKGGNQGGYLSSLGDSYGTSAYMLFYERRVKKDLKIVVLDAQVEEEKARGVDVQYDEEKKENFKMCPYRRAADGELANDIYKKVADDNQKFTFEGDIYSTEFFDFILQILQSVAEQAVDTDTKLNGLKIGSKLGFEILARLMMNPGIDRVAQVMIDILKSRPEITKPFMEAMCDLEASEVIWEVLLLCNDKNAQKQLARVIKYALCQLKIEEKQCAMAMQMDNVTTTFTDDDGNNQNSIVQRPSSICIRFVTLMTEQLSERAPKNWRKFDSFLEIFHDFMVFSAEEIDQQKEIPDQESEAYKVGVELYFLYDMIRHLGDFILQENSPYSEPGQIRQTMGGNYGNPNLSKILKTIIMMIKDKPMMEKYPLVEKNQAIASHKDILQKMIDPGEGAGQEFNELLLSMAVDNEKVTKKLAMAYLKGVAKPGNEQIATALKQIREFLKIDDSLKMQRLEWIFGVPQVVSKVNYKNKTMQYGQAIIDLVNDEYYSFKSGCFKGIQEAVLGILFKAKGRMETQCLIGLRHLTQIIAEDAVVAKFIFNQPAPSLQYARYSDWLFSHTEQVFASTNQAIKNSSTVNEFHMTRIQLCEEILKTKEGIEAMFKPWIEEQKTKLAAMPEASFKGYIEQTLYPQVPEIIPSYPPAYIVGLTDHGSARVVYTKDTELATITLEEVPCEYMFSNPQGLYNLSVADKMCRNPQYTSTGYKSWKIEQLKQAAVEGYTPSMAEIVTKDWLADKSAGFSILKCMIKSKSPKMIRVSIKFSVADNENKNVVFPMTELKESLFSNDLKHAFVFTKIDPSQANWGDLDLDVTCKVGKTSQISTTYGTSYGNSGTTYSSYSNYQPQGYATTSSTTGTVMTTQTQSNIGDQGGSVLNCANCTETYDYGEEYCKYCGKSTTESEFGPQIM